MPHGLWAGRGGREASSQGGLVTSGSPVSGSECSKAWDLFPS